MGFLRTCPLAIRLPGDVVVCHSLPENLENTDFDASVLQRELDMEDFQPHGSLFNMLWGRDYREENARRFAKQIGASVLIHGHDPCPQGHKTPNDVQVILDCCARPASYVVLPLDKPLDHAQVVKRIEQL
jgi:hypothetical protein